MSITPQQQLRAVVKTLERLASEVTDPVHAEALQTHADSLRKLADDVTPKSASMLTPAQARVLAFIRSFITERRGAPTRKEMAEHFECTPNAIQEHLRSLARKGAITIVDGMARGIRVNSTRTLTLPKTNSLIKGPTP